MKRCILVVDDDASIRKFVRANLIARDYGVLCAQNGLEALNLIKKQNVDLIILDITMPYLDGYEVCRRVREESQIPIIMLSARDAEDDKLRCLELGADDYITKPFSLNELLCRIKVVFRRSQDPYVKMQSRLTCGDLEIDQDLQRIYYRGQEIALTGQEYQVTVYLTANAGRVVDRDHILEKVRSQKNISQPRLLWEIMCRLRKKFDLLAPGCDLIRTVPGVGYILSEKGQEIDPAVKSDRKIARAEYQHRLEKKIAIQAAEIQRLSLSGIEALIHALEAKDKYTAGHSHRVTGVSLALGRSMGLGETELEDLRWGSLLHDVGKIAVDPSIQNKPDHLTKEEYEQIMIHPQVGAEIVKPVVNDQVVKIIAHHHDHFDGKGLHQTISGYAIPLGARIIAVSDAFDAMTSDRPYRSAMKIDEAVKEIQHCRSTQFDPLIVSVFMNLAEHQSHTLLSGVN